MRTRLVTVTESSGVRARGWAAALVTACTVTLQAALALAATTPPVLWAAGGLDAGNTGAGQAGHVAVDTAGNVVVVSGPSGGRLLTTTSYTSDGLLRWRRSEAPSAGTFMADWVAAAPGGDVVVLGHNLDSSGRAITHTVLRYGPDGTLRWRLDPPGRLFGLARLVVDGAGNTYVGVNSQVDKYNAAGVLQWSQTLTAGLARSLALSPDGADVVLVGGGASWATAVVDTATGARRWAVAAPEGLGGADVVVDATRVYVAGQGVTGASTPAIAYHFTVIAYDRATGARLWRSDKRPADGSSGAALRLTRAPDGSLVATGQTLRGFLDWYTVAFETNGTTRWEAVRDGGLNTDELPAAVLTLNDGTTVVSGRGGPNLPGGYIPGVTVGYSPGGTLLWQAFSPMSTVWATALATGDVCAAGGYDALVTCWRLGAPATAPAAPSNLTLRAITGAIVATWVDHATDETAYAVERAEYTGTAFTPYATIATLPANTITFADTTFPSGRELSYRIRATNAGGDSPYSNTANIQLFSTNTPPTAVATATPVTGAAPLP
ncbi:MAG: hypothetical protein IT181_25160, partial [Acidobacteria bacterium]|nr:hypothetical protein [Acidobacteriota bacterium]